MGDACEILLSAVVLSTWEECMTILLSAVELPIMGGCMTILLSAVELPIWEDTCQYFYLLWSCLHGKTHDKTFIYCGVAYTEGRMPILLSAVELSTWEDVINTLVCCICCGVVYMGRCMTNFLYF